MQRRRISDTPVGMMHLACPGGRFWFVLHCIVVVLCPYCMCTVLAHSFSFFLSQLSIVENEATVAEYSYASLISGESGAELWGSMNQNNFEVSFREICWQFDKGLGTALLLEWRTIRIAKHSIQITLIKIDQLPPFLIILRWHCAIICDGNGVPTHFLLTCYICLNGTIWNTKL